MMRVRTASEQLDASTIKGQWRNVCETDLGAWPADLMSSGAGRSSRLIRNRLPHDGGPGNWSRIPNQVFL